MFTCEIIGTEECWECEGGDSPSRLAISSLSRLLSIKETDFWKDVALKNGSEGGGRTYKFWTLISRQVSGETGENKDTAEQFQRGCNPPKISTLTEEAADTVLKATIYSSLHTSVDWSCVHVKGFYVSSVDPFFRRWGEIDAETFVVVVHCHGQHLL